MRISLDLLKRTHSLSQLSLPLSQRNLVAAFATSCLVSLLLLRCTGAIWPVYLLAAAGIIHLYSVLFSKGATLASITVFYLLVVGGWLLSAGGAWFFSIPNLPEFLKGAWGGLAGFLSAQSIWFVCALALMAIVWTLRLVLDNEQPALPLGARFYLATGAAVFAIWGVWGIYVSNPSVRPGLYQSILVLAVVVPVLLLVVLLQRNRRNEPIPELTALWALLLAGLLVITSVLTDSVSFALLQIFPAMMGLQRPILGPNFLSVVLDQRITIAAALGALFVFLWVLAGVARAYKKFEAPIGSVSEIELESTPLGTVLEEVASYTTNVLFSIAASTAFLSVVFSEMATILVEMKDTSLKCVWQMTSYLVLPILTFSLLSILTSRSLFLLQSYIAGVRSISVLDVWGESIIAAAAALLLCGSAFGLPSLRITGAMGPVFQTALYIVIGYMGLSLVAIGVPMFWFGLQRGLHVDVAWLRPGPLFTINWLASFAVVVAIVWIAGGPGRSISLIGIDKPGQLVRSRHTLLALTPFGAFAAFAMWAGGGGLWGAFASAFS